MFSSYETKKHKKMNTVTAMHNGYEKCDNFPIEECTNVPRQECTSSVAVQTKQDECEDITLFTLMGCVIKAIIN